MNFHLCNTIVYKKDNSKSFAFRYKTQADIGFPPRCIKISEFSNDTSWIYPNDIFITRNWETLDFDTAVSFDTLYSIRGQLFIKN
jgi:hypothetical protein